MRIRKITTMLLVASALAAAPISAEEADETADSTDTPAEGQKPNHGQKRHRRENMSDEEKQAMRARFENMSDEDKQAMRARFENMSDADKQAMRERRDARRGRWESMSDEERQAAREKRENRKGDKGERHGRPSGHDGSSGNEI